MQKRSMKQKCLAWVLSLAVALTFIPLTAGFAFADDAAAPDYFINLAKANGSQFDDNEVKVYVNLAEPWQVGDDIVATQVATGKEMKPVIDNLNCKMGYGSFDLDSADADGNKYFTVDYGEGDWTAAGDYTLKVVANEKAGLVDGKFGTAKFTGTYELPCKIVEDPLDLANSTVEFAEGTVNKKGQIEIAYDGKLHKLVPKEVVDTFGDVVDPSYYEVTYPNETTNAYRKVGEFDIVITAKKGNAGGYTGSITKVVSIADVVTDITVYTQVGKGGEKKQVKVFKYASWGNYALDTPIQWGYNGSVWESSSYIPVEALITGADLEITNVKDLIDIYTNSSAEHYFNAPQAIADLQKYVYTPDGKKVLEVFGGEYTIPAFLVLDTESSSAAPRGAVGAEESGGTPRGNMSPSCVSEIVLVSMDIAGLEAEVKNATYTGKAVAPEVMINDGDEIVPVTVSNATGKKIGQYTATVTANEDSGYYGTQTVKYKVVPKGKKIGQYTATVTANEDSGYYGTQTVKYKVVPKGTKIKSVKGGKKKITVKWSKQKTQTSGYQVRYSKNADFTGAKIKTITKNKTTKKTIKKLKKKTTYYVQVRTYKKVKGKKYVSAWSETKTVKTK